MKLVVFSLVFENRWQWWQCCIKKNNKTQRNQRARLSVRWQLLQSDVTAEILCIAALLLYVRPQKFISSCLSSLSDCSRSHIRSPHTTLVHTVTEQMRDLNSCCYCAATGHIQNAKEADSACILCSTHFLLMITSAVCWSSKGGVTVLLKC